MMCAARRLRRRDVRLANGHLRRVSIFPFFNQEGRTRSLLVVDPDRAEIGAVAWRDGVFQPRFVGPDRLNVMPNDLAPLRADDLSALETLWHYDPWWVLRDEPHDGDPVVPVLAQTNCYDQLGGKRSAVSFSRDLSRIAHVATKRANQGGVWTRALLPRTPHISCATPLARVPHETRWTLAPSWQR